MLWSQLASPLNRLLFLFSKRQEQNRTTPSFLSLFTIHDVLILSPLSFVHNNWCLSAFAIYRTKLYFSPEPAVSSPVNSGPYLIAVLAKTRVIINNASLIALDGKRLTHIFISFFTVGLLISLLTFSRSLSQSLQDGWLLGIHMQHLWDRRRGITEERVPRRCPVKETDAATSRPQPINLKPTRRRFHSVIRASHWTELHSFDRRSENVLLKPYC
ncbi:uncharacterized protein LOC127525823 [Erpetoichthys calabaricus]|uniref:uncharacterized protein LOC127525823 n=1 Tax=Erpetoichthys calabaricus TaxID=27687 RepID=UPI002234D8E3|nr:uncharacterized protein LOC127525823 [Erpetoichthys calabaricus]